MKRLLSLALFAALAASSVHANDWGNFAIISSTMGNNGGRICVGEGLRANDIGCPTYAPSISTAGHVSITGNVSANKFIGDGSGLTGVTAGSSDRIVSGSTGGTRMVAISDTGYISITQAGANSAWFDPYRGLVALGVSTTGGISGTTGYFSGRVGVGTIAPVAPLQVNGGLMVGASSTLLEPSGRTIQMYASSGNSRLILESGAGSGKAFVLASGGDTLSMQMLGSGGVANNLTIVSSSNIGIGTYYPSVSLTVVGEVQVSNSGVACGTNTRGSLRYEVGANSLQICNTVGWVSMASGTTGAATAASSTGAVQFNVNNTLAGDTDNLFWDDTNNKLGVGTSSPSRSIHIVSSPGNPPTMIFENSAAPLDQKKRYLNSTSGAMGFGSFSDDMVSSTEHARITSAGYLGLGTTTPSATLTVSGSAIISGTVQVAGAANETCTTGKLGTIRFNPVTGAPQICVQR